MDWFVNYRLVSCYIGKYAFKYKRQAIGIFQVVKGRVYFDRV
ncbi:hypothetical protein JOD02_002180 [Caldicoprobacter guelmensis]|nr:hypothetical protein [Caldicoprobacter guelmensis]